MERRGKVFLNGEKIEEKRKALGIKPVELREACVVSYTFYRNAIKGKSMFSELCAKEIARLLEMSYEDVIKKSEDSKSKTEVKSEAESEVMEALCEFKPVLLKMLEEICKLNSSITMLESDIRTISEEQKRTGIAVVL